MSHSVPSVECQLTDAVVFNNLAKVKEIVAVHGLPAEMYALLLDAVKFNRTEIVKYLLENGVEVNSIESSTDSLLHFPVANENMELVELLLENGAAVDALNDYKETPLHSAVITGNADIVRLLLKKGARCLPDFSKFEPLHVACFRQSANIVELLLSARAWSEAAKAQSLDVPLLIASQSGNEQIVSLLLGAGADPNTYLSNNLMHHSYGSLLDLCSVKSFIFPVHLACERGHLGVVKLLLEHREEQVNYVKSWDNFTPLHSACENGHVDVVRFLLSKSADPNFKAKDGSTPLHIAAMKGRAKVVDVLCNNGANIEARTAEDFTPILLVARWPYVTGHKDVARSLLNRGACVDAKDKYGKTSLFYAVENLNSLVTNCILQFKPKIDLQIYRKICDTLKDKSKGCNPAIDEVIVYCVTAKLKNVRDFSLAQAVEKGYKKTVETLLAYGAKPEKISGLLHSAVENGHYEIIQSLLQSGCGVNSKDPKGKTPICYLFDNYKKDIYFDILQLLLSKGANLKEAPTLLHSAVHFGFFEICKCLIENGANVNAAGPFGETPLHHVIGFRYITVFPSKTLASFDDKIKSKIARLLLSHGANANSKDNFDCTLLYYAVQFNNLEVVSVLLEFKADLNVQNGMSQTALHLTVQMKFDALAEVLLKNGAEVDVRGPSARRPLHDAVGRAEVVKLLLKFHADVNAQDIAGWTALHRALEASVQSSVPKSYHEVVTVLLDSGYDVNIEDRSGSTALDIVKRNNFDDKILRKIVARHVLKLKIAGLFISAKSKRFLSGKWVTSDDELKDFKLECKEEVKRMKRLKLGHLKLYDVLVNPSNLAFVANETVIRSFESVNLNQFPVYQSLIENKVKKNRQINAGKKWLSVLVKTRSLLCQEKVQNLPLELLLEIVSYLDEKDLHHLIECGEALKCQLC